VKGPLLTCQYGMYSMHSFPPTTKRAVDPVWDKQQTQEIFRLLSLLNSQRRVRRTD
jgi:hypothetical protein